jgi:hypothetical protein
LLRGSGTRYLPTDREDAVRKLIGILVLAAIGFVGYRWFIGWRAVIAYERFAEAWMRGNKVGADLYGEADAVRVALEDHSLRGMPSGALIETFHGSDYTIESRTWSPEGDLLIEAKQTIYFDPPGVTSGIGGAMLTHIHHTATVRKTPDGWRVVAFDAKYIDMGEIRRH